MHLPPADPPVRAVWRAGGALLWAVWLSGCSQPGDGDSGVDPQDSDGDGYGSAASGGADCDDTDGDVHPAAPEFCGDGIDSDCNGADPPCEPVGAVDVVDAAAARLTGQWGAVDLDGWQLAAGDLDLDGTTDLVLSRGQTSNSQAQRGIAFLLHGPLSGTVTSDQAVATLVQDDADEAGDALDLVGDLDGDGRPELALGAPSAGDGYAGAVYIFSLPLDGTWTTQTANTIWSVEDGVDFGAVLGHGDLDGDGDPDLLVADPRAVFTVGALATERHGGVYAITRSPGDDRDVDGELWIRGTLDQSDFGAALASADMDGDGIDDVVVGLPAASEGAAAAGKIALFLGSPGNTIDAEDADASRLGSLAGDSLGTAVQTGDLDGDGLPEILASAPKHSSDGTRRGAVYVERGPVSGAGTIDATAAVRWLGETDDDRLGTSVAAPADVNGDGLLDVALGAPDAIRSQGAGRAYLVLGPMGGTSSMGEAAHATCYTGSAQVTIGTALLLADLDGDDRADLVSSAFTAPTSGGTGQVLLVPGLALVGAAAD